jgi:TonB family protein
MGLSDRDYMREKGGVENESRRPNDEMSPATNRTTAMVIAIAILFSLLLLVNFLRGERVDESAADAANTDATTTGEVTPRTEPTNTREFLTAYKEPDHESNVLNRFASRVFNVVESESEDMANYTTLSDRAKENFRQRMINGISELKGVMAFYLGKKTFSEISCRLATGERPPHRQNFTDLFKDSNCVTQLYGGVVQIVLFREPDYANYRDPQSAPRLGVEFPTIKTFDGKSIYNGDSISFLVADHDLATALLDKRLTVYGRDDCQYEINGSLDEITTSNSTIHLNRRIQQMVSPYSPKEVNCESVEYPMTIAVALDISALLSVALICEDQDCSGQWPTPSAEVIKNREAAIEARLNDARIATTSSGESSEMSDDILNRHVFGNADEGQDSAPQSAENNNNNDRRELADTTSSSQTEQRVGRATIISLPDAKDFYPTKARDNASRGKSVLAVCVDRNHQIIGIDLITSSGNELLDSAAFNYARAGRYNAGLPDQGVAEERSCVNVHVEFK